MPKTNVIPAECKICGIAASYSYYGAVACEPCKMFFKRNAQRRKETLKCDFGGCCEVSIYNRHVCSVCRLAKCFKVGMCSDSIRLPQTMKKRQASTSSTLVKETTHTNKRPYQLTTLNLLERDRSLLTTDQWTLLSNLIHSYDEHNTLPIAKDFMKQLDSLHPKLRFKIPSSKILEFHTIFYDATEPFIRSNHDFTTLPSHDRSIVLRGAVDNVTCLGGSFVIRQSGLSTNSAFRNGLENTFGSIPYNLTMTAISLIDQDVNIAKLSFALSAFCTSTCTLFDVNTSHMYLSNNRMVLRIQDMYAELLWKYLLYKYTFDQAVVRFNRLVQCIIVIFTVRTHLQNVRIHTDVIDSLIRKIEQQQININDN